MKFDRIIKGGTVVRHTGRMRADVGVAEGRIVHVGIINDANGAEVIDASGCMVLPGIIDPHVHMTILPSPGRDAEQLLVIERDIETESLAAAFGGVTTFLPMINLEGPYSPHIDRLQARIRECSYMDAGMTVVVSGRHHVQEMPRLAAAGVSGFKHFLNAYRRDQAIGALLPVEEATFFKSLETIRSLGAPALAMVHAEDVDLVNYFESDQRSRSSQADLHALAMARPAACEAIRMQYVAEASRAIGARVYLCHCSSYHSLCSVEPFIRSGVDVAVEAVTHCLTNTYHVWDRVGVWGKFSPPLRATEDRAALWAGLRAGLVRHVASDHCTWTREEKENGGGQFGPVWNAMPGISNGMEHLLPALVTYGIRTGEMSWEGLVTATSYNTASRFGYLPRKGLIAEGADADLVVVDPNQDHEVGPSFYHGRGRDWSLFWGERLYGRPKATLSRGRIVQLEGQLVGGPGHASFIPAG